MIFNKTKKILHRTTKRHCRTRSSFLLRCHRTYRTISSSLTLCLKLYLFFARLTRKITILCQRLERISYRIHGWIRLIRAIFSTVHLFVSTLMNFIAKVYQIFDLLTILLQPLTNRTLDKAFRAFSHGFYDYYSSNGACYTLKDRTHQILQRFRARWKSSRITLINQQNDEIFYDADEQF